MIKLANMQTMIMVANLNEKERQFYKMCEEFDHTYTYSDDYQVYKRGQAQNEKLQRFSELLDPEKAVWIYNLIVRDKFPSDPTPFMWKKAPGEKDD